MSALFFVDGDVDAITKLPDVPFEVINANQKTAANIKKFNAASREGKAVLTNCIWLLNHTVFDAFGYPHLWFYADGKWFNVCELTKRRIRPGINFERLFLAGEFEIPMQAADAEADFLRKCGKIGLLCVTLNDKVILSYDGVVREYNFDEAIKLLQTSGMYDDLKRIVNEKGCV